VRERIDRDKGEEEETCEKMIEGDGQTETEKGVHAMR